MDVFYSIPGITKNFHYYRSPCLFRTRPSRLSFPNRIFSFRFSSDRTNNGPGFILLLGLLRLPFYIPRGTSTDTEKARE
jgi:hypothetical protein